MGSSDWVLSPVPKIVVYEYQKTRHSDHPKEYYRNFKGVLMTDGLEQYHKLAREQEGLINAKCLAQASAIIYSITETARANNLNVYYYIRHLLTELPQLKDKNGNIEQSLLEPLMPWSKNLPVNCYSKRRN